MNNEVYALSTANYQLSILHFQLLNAFDAFLPEQTIGANDEDDEQNDVGDNFS